MNDSLIASRSHFKGWELGNLSSNMIPKWGGGGGGGGDT